MDIDKTAQEFKDLIELREYCDKQYNTILSLQQKIQNLEEENKHLKDLLGSSGPLLVENNNYNLEENIAKVQLSKLNEHSLQRELTLEECKKVEIYTKILNVKGREVKDVFAEVRKLDSKELLSQLENV